MEKFIKIKYLNKNKNEEKCKICNQNINFQYETGKCETNYEKEIVIKHNFHMNCFLKYPKQNNLNYKNKSYRSVNLKICPNCNGKIITKSSVYICPICNKSNRDPIKYKHICVNPECKYVEENTKPVNNWICPKCKTKPNNYIGNLIHHHICGNPECKFEQDTNNANWTCPNCGWNCNNYHHICGNPNCKYEEDTKGTNWICPNCGWTNHGEYEHICPDCGNFEITNNSNWVCSVCGYNGTNYNHKCTNPDCGYEESNPTPQNRWTCPKCKRMPNQQTFKHNCKNCGYNEENSISPLMWICPNCGWEPENSICKNRNIIIYCKSCNNETPHKWNNKNNKLECQVCNGNLVYNF